MPSGIVQACSRCKTQKRKCDRRLPACSLCKRLNRVCSYPILDGESHKQQAGPLPVPELHELSSSNICDTLYKQISAIVGDGQQVEAWAAVYFRTIHPWFPIISQTSFFNRLVPTRVTFEPADFCLLNLTMYLVCAKPVNGELTSQTKSLYLLLKSLVSTLEAVGINSIEMLQGRLLLTVFEVGHGLYPSAYISSGATGRAACDLGVNAASPEELLKIFGSQERAEEAQRIWNGINVVDRYVTLERAKGPCHSIDSFLEKNRSSRETKDHAVLTQTDHLTELTQASQLLAQVLAHIYETTSNHTFKALEALQLLKTVTSFLAKCSKGSPAQNIVFCSAAAVSRSAMLEILEYGSQLDQRSIKHCDTAALDMLQTLVNEIAQAAASALYIYPLVTVDALPIFIPYCIYKATMVYLQVLRQPGQGDTEVIIRPLMDLLRLIGTRWAAAGNYVRQIEKFNVETKLTY